MLVLISGYIWITVGVLRIRILKMKLKEVGGCLCTFASASLRVPGVSQAGNNRSCERVKHSHMSENG